MALIFFLLGAKQKQKGAYGIFIVIFFLGASEIKPFARYGTHRHRMDSEYKTMFNAHHCYKVQPFDPIFVRIEYFAG